MKKPSLSKTLCKTAKSPALALSLLLLLAPALLPPLARGAITISTGTTITGTAGTSTLYDSGNSNTNRFTIANNITATFTLENSATMTFTRNVFSTAGGAFLLNGSGAKLIFQAAAPDSWFVFTSNTSSTAQGGAIQAAGGYVEVNHGLFTLNTSGSNGGAINVTSGTAVINDSIFRNNAATGSNDGGALAASSAGGLLQVTNVLFESNTAGYGGAIWNGGASISVVATSTFLNNIATTSGGGGAYFTNGSNSGTFNNVVFQGNRLTNASAHGGAMAANGANTIKWTINGALFTGNAANAGGGAIYISANLVTNTLLINNALFQSNTAGATGANAATANGGAIGYDLTNGTGLLTLADSSFLDNVAGASGNGGAIWFNGGTFNYTITTSATIAGNKRGATSANYNGIYFSATGANISTTATFNIDGAAGAAARLDMLDPMGAADINLALAKTGPGAWNLGGSSTLGLTTAAAINLTISAGALHLYRAGETSGAYTAPTGNLTLNGATSTFTLAAPATLSAGGGNTLAATTIKLDPAATLELNLLNLATNTAGGASLLTLNAATFDTTAWAQTLSFLNPDYLATLPLVTATYNLISLAGPGATASPFTNASFGGLDTYTFATNGFKLGTDGATLWLDYAYIPAGGNHVILWNGSAGAAAATWSGTNWLAAATHAPTAYNYGDAVNLADDTTGAPAPAATTINVNTPAATIAGMYLSGTTNYTITGNPITTSATSGDIAGAAPTGKLILGAQAADGAGGASTLDTTTPAAAYTGTLTLANTANKFENGIDILSGALVGNAANLATAASATTTIAAPASLTFNQTTTGTYPTQLAGAGALLKTGTATLTLTADSSAFAGATEVREGKLLLGNNGASAAAPAPGSAGVPPALGGAIHVASGATFGGTGTAGSVALAPAATLQVGLADSPSALQPFSLSALSLSPGSILDYTPNIANQLYVAGAISLTGTSIINIANTVTTGSYSLINAPGGFTGGTFDATLFDVNWGGNLLAPGANYNLTYDGTLLWLTMLDASAFTNKVLTWTNAAGIAGGNLWLTSTNWTPDAGATNKTFVQGDIVNLTDSTNNPAVPPTSTFNLNLNSSATASAIYVSGTSSFAITGTAAGAALVTATGVGQLATGTAANGKLTLGKNAADPNTITTAGAAAFTGTLDLTALTGPNNFTQGIEIASGALRVSTTAQLGTTLNKLAFTGPAANNATLIIAGDMTLDGNNTAANILSFPAGTVAGAFIVEDGYTLTITRNTSNGNGGAFNITANDTFTLAAGSNAHVIFTSNTAIDPGTGNINGGVFSVTSAGSKLTLTATNGGGAGGFLFQNNYARGSGGAIFVNTGAAFVDSATFIGNSATTQGGAVAVQSAAATNGQITLTNVLFVSNSNYGNGGALGVATNARATITNADFRDNVSLSNNGGGAIYISNGTTITNLTNVNFTGNRATATLGGTGNGGAIWLGGNNAVLNLNVTTGGTSLFAANVSTTNATPNSIHFNNTASMLLTASVAPGAAILMLDPMSGAAATTTTISKIGAGAWFLGGSSTLGNGTTSGYTFAVNEGTLHLYRDAETTATYTRADGSTATAIATTGNLTILGNTSSFTLARNATLSAGGGNTLAATTITLAPGSILDYSLATTPAPNGPGGAPLLTLNATTLNLATAGLANFHLNLATWTTGSYNLLYTAAPGATTSLATLITDNAQSLLSTLSYTGLLPAIDPTLGIDPATGLLYITFTSTDTLDNTTLTWNGSTGTAWYGVNWTGRPSGRFSQNDIVNFADSPGGAPVASTTASLATTATLGAMYLSGTTSYTITGAPIVTATTAGKLAGTPAYTGKLILGASAAPDASAITTLPYTGTLTLTNTANTFTNGIDILSGALAGNAASLNVGTSASVAIAPGATLTFNQLTTATYTAPVSGAGLLVKTNTATLTLAANNATFTGTTNINAGTLLLPAASTLGGLININSTATLAGSGTAAGNVAINNAGTLQVGAAGGAPLAILGNLTLNTGAILEYTTIGNLLAIAGNFNVTGPSTINLDAGTLLISSSYSLLNASSYGALNNTLLAVNYKGAPLDTTDYLLTTDASNLLWLTILNLPVAANNVLVWTNAAGDTAWLASKNWTVAGAGLTKTFAQGDIVNLTDSTNNPAVPPTSTFNLNLNSTATASAINLAGTASYAIAGPGALVTATGAGILATATAATGKLTLGAQAAPDATATAYTAFTGTLDLTGITGPNNFAQGIEINTGALRLSTTAQLGATLNKLAITGTGTLIIASSMTLDGGGPTGGAPNHLALTATNANATFILENGVTLTISNNFTTLAGAAIGLAGGAIETLTLAAGTNALYLFTSNSTSANGGAIAAPQTNTLRLTRALFTANTGNNGGAIFLNTGATAYVTSATFAGNYAAANGGAITLFNGSTLTLTDALFTGNRSAANGGAISSQTASALIATNVLFASNTAIQGAGLFQATGPANLTDVSFVNNNASTLGGAIYLNNANTGVNLNVSAGSTSQFAGNTTGTAGINLAPSSIHVTNNAGMFININPAAAASLDMLDPITTANAAAANTLAITKTGPGAWNLGATNTLGTATTSAITLSINAGTLHLYHAGETSTGPGGTFAATTGNITILGGSLTLATGATLSAGGGNTITAPAINLNPGSTLALDTALATPNTTSLLTLNATTFTTATWNQNLALLNLAALDAATGDTFNLLTIAGTGTAASPLTTAAFNNFTTITGLINGYDLALTPDNLTLQLSFSGSVDNHLVTWTGATSNLWRGANWTDATGTITTTARGDIVNLAGAGAAGNTTAPVPININSPTGVAAIYLSGTQSYTLTGNSLTATATAGTLAGAPAATGKLILGAKATDNPQSEIRNPQLTTTPFTGTLTLANTANLFTAGIDILTGALVGNADTLAVGPAAGVTIAAGALLTFNQPATGTYAAPLTGQGALIKTNTGALTLTANNSTFTGATTVQTGALLLGSAPVPGAGSGVPPEPSAPSLGGAIHVATAATFGGTGTAGPLTLDSRATLQIGLASDNPQSLTLASLTLSPNTLLDYTTITNQLLVTNTTTLLGPATINLGTLTTGSYALITAATLAGFNTNPIAITYQGTLLDADTYALAPTPTQLWLIFATLPNNIITWTNATRDNLWLSSPNWSTTGANASTRFHQGDIVNLSGADSPLALQPFSPLALSSSATTAAIYISGTASYALAGAPLVTDPKAGLLAGGTAANGKLTLGKLATTATVAATPATFTGTLDLTAITGTNNFAQGIEIASGALRVAGNDQFGTTLGKLTFTTGQPLITGSTTLGGVSTGSSFLGGMVVNLVTPGGAVQFAGNATFDGKNTNANRLVITASNSALLTLDDGVTLTIANDAPAASGAAINLGNRAALVIAAGAGAQVAFTNNNTNPSGNTTNYDGGAIYLTTNATLTLGDPSTNATFLFTANTARRSGGAIYQNSTTTLVAYNTLFTGNKTSAGTGTSGNGGAIAALNVNSRLFLNNATFTNNTAFNGGGAIYLNTRATAIIQTATFANNTASGANGGGALVVHGTAIFTATNVAFTGNTATSNGGAIALATNGSKIDLTTALFDSNSSGTAGGAINLANAGAARLADTTFTNNTAATTGGAINVSGASAAINLQVSAGNLARFAGNKAAGSPNSIYFAPVSGLTFNIDTAPAATLDMLDPMNAANAGLRIIKTGPGSWNLAGNNTLGASTAGNIDLAITAGALRLYRAGETTADAATPAPATASLAITLGSFTLASSSTLALGGGPGGNAITAPTITLSGTSTLSLDLLKTTPNTPASTVLTLTDMVLNPAGWTQTLDLHNIDTTLGAHDNGATYNLLTLAGGTATYPALYIDPAIADTYNATFAGPFTSATTFTLAAPLPTGYTLQVAPDHKTLQLLYTAPVLHNTVLTTNTTANTLLDDNWTTPATFNRGDIINLANATTLAINTISTATLAALYVSGTASTTITGANPIVTDPAATLLAGTPAATGKLTLGAQANNDASAITPANFTGTLTLSNTANLFLGGIDILAGALVGNDKTLDSGTAGIAIAAGASLTFNQPASGTYTAPLTGAGALLKTGPATLTLTANNSTFTGTTTVQTGALLLGSAPVPGAGSGVPPEPSAPSLGGAIHVATAATFGGTGTAGAVTLDSNATLQLGTRNSELETLSLQSLTLSPASILDYSPTPGATLHVAGPITQLSGLTTINIADFNATATRDLGNLAPLLATSTLTIAGAAQYPDARKQATLSAGGANGSDLILTTTRDISRILYWTGETGTLWQLTGANWANSSTKVFGTGDIVVFTDTTPLLATTTITVAPAGATASAMLVDGASNYTFLGGPITTDAATYYTGETANAAGSAGILPATAATEASDMYRPVPTGIDAALAPGAAAPTVNSKLETVNSGGEAASGKLTKLGPGTLALNNTGVNNFTAGIDLLAGALSIGGTTTATAITAAGATTLAGNGALRFTSLTLTGGMVNAAIAPGNTLTLGAAPAIAIAGGGPGLATGDGGILKTGAGELRYSGAGAFGYAGITQLDQGTLRITDFAITGSTITLPFTLVPIIYNTIFVPTDTFTIASGVTLTGTTPNLISLGTAAPTTITLVNPSLTLTGTNVIPSATVTIGGVQTIIPSATVTMPPTTLTIPNVTGTVIGSIFVIPASSFTIPNYYQDASAIAQNIVLNGGTLALGTVSAAASGASGGNDSTANNWRGLRLIQAAGATSSVITGVNDIVYIGAGTFAPQLTGGLHVAIDPAGLGDAGTGEPNALTTLGNSLNNFTGVVIAMSGTLQVTNKAQLGSSKAANNTQIALWGGAVEFVNSMTFAGDFAVRTATNTIITDPGANVALTRIYRNAALTPAGAEFVKAGSGTLTLTGADQATALTAAAGRIVITASNGLPSGSVSGATVYGNVTAGNDAVIQFSPNLPGVSGTLGLFAGAPYTPSVSGTIRNAFQGSGTLELTDSNLVLTNAKTTIARINIGPNANVAIQATSFSPAGTITVDSGALILAADKQTLGNVILRNNAFMGFIMSGSVTSPGVFTTPAYPLRNATLASLTAENGTAFLFFNTHIAEGYADHLTVNSPVSGTFAIFVANFTSTIAPDTPSKNFTNLELINSPATTTGTFVIGTPVIPIGAYNYDVTGTNNNGIYSVIITGNGDMSYTAAAINAASAMLPMTWFSELDSISRRLGEIRHDDQAPKHGFSAWTSGYAEKLNFNGKLTGANFSARHLGGQAGLDYKFGGATSALLGAFMGYGQTQRGYTATLADASNQSVFGGIYATLAHPAGWYADTVFKLNNFRNRFTTIDPSSAQNDSADYRTWAAGGSLEIGKRQTLPYDWNFTPMLQAAYTKVAAKSYATANTIQVALDSGATTQARAGFLFGRDIETQNHGAISAYVKAYYGRQWTHGGAQLITIPGLAPARFAAVIEGYGITAGAGFSWQFTKATQFYLDYETTQADYYIKPYALNAGLRHTW